MSGEEHMETKKIPGVLTTLFLPTEHMQTAD
jgi:hypothetical protein